MFNETMQFSIKHCNVQWNNAMFNETMQRSMQQCNAMFNETMQCSMKQCNFQWNIAMFNETMQCSMQQCNVNIERCTPHSSGNIRQWDDTIELCFNNICTYGSTTKHWRHQPMHHTTSPSSHTSSISRHAEWWRYIPFMK